jgi:hypothetical protein
MDSESKNGIRVVASVPALHGNGQLKALTSASLSLGHPYKKKFLPRARNRFRGTRIVAMLIREAFLRGLSTRRAGRVWATLTAQVASPQAMWKLTATCG